MLFASLHSPCACGSKARREQAMSASYPSGFRRSFGWMPDGVAEHVVHDWDAEN